MPFAHQSVHSQLGKEPYDLQQKQEALSLPKHKLIADISTCWGSTSEMFSHMIAQQQAMCAVLTDDQNFWSKRR